MRWLLLLVSVSFAASAAMLSATVLLSARGVVAGWPQLVWGKARRRFASLADREETGLACSLSDAELYGLPRVNWPALAVLAAVIGLTITTLTFRLVPAALAGVAAALFPLAIRACVFARGKRRLRHQVLCFMSDLTLSLRLPRSLEQALTLVGRDALGPQDVLRKRLRLCLQAGLSPIDTLRRLSSDLHSKELQELLERVDVATCGETSYAQAIGDAAAILLKDEQARVAEESQRVCARLIWVMVAGMAGPLLVLALSPMLARF